MRLSRSVLASALTVAALLGGAAIPAGAQKQSRSQELAKPESSFSAGAAANAWPTVIARTERGHLIGNPEAESRMIEFVSYTCPHCASFTDQGEPGLELTLIAPGKMSLEVRSVIRNPLDLVATLLAGCGDPARFKDRHRLLMNTQDTWATKASNAPVSQQQIWMRADASARVNMANAIGLIDTMTKAGQSRVEVTNCLTNDKAALALLDGGDADRAEFAFPGTPSFALDGKLIDNVHDWKSLYPVLSARFAAGPAAASENSTLNQ